MRKHCTMNELLALKDGEGLAWAREHLDGCSFCQREMDLVHARVAALRALPAIRPPRDRWMMVREQAVRMRRVARLRRAGWGALALAAGLALMVGIRGWEPGSGPVGTPVAMEEAPEVAELVAQSRELEAALQEYGTEGRVLNARTAGIIADLESGIAAVDAGIMEARVRGSRDELVDLWRSRVNLMDALVSAHVTRTAYVGF
ncbi:MAG TPA: hypothetical protein VFH97_00280 [Gemmatimonadales bacterium]|nr:hypothetical protein [Gemmatimonadales bacterium]